MQTISRLVRAGRFLSARVISRGSLAGMLAAGGLICGCVSPPPPLSFDLAGKAMDPFAITDSAATVLIFVSDDCPIANRYVPEIRRLQDTYASRGVRFWLVHADPAETPAEIREHDHKFNLTIPSLRDPQHYLVRLAGVEVTPSAALFTPGGILVYHGRIDDRVTELERERPEPAHRDLADALDAVLSGHPVPVAATQAVGCFIPGAN